MLTVGIDARVLNLPITGVGLYVTKLIDYLAARDDVFCRLFSWHDIETPSNWQGKTEVIPLGGTRGVIWEELRLPSAIKQNPVDVYHATWNRGAPPRRICPSILTIHDIIPLISPGRFTDKLQHRLALQTAVSRARTVFTDSESTRRDIITNLRVKPDKIVTAHLGLPSNYARCSRGDIDKCKELYNVSGYFVFVGGIDRRKNVDRIIQAFVQVSSNDPELKLLVLGAHNALVDELKKLADDLRVGDRVAFPGYVPQSDKIALLSGALAMVYPSQYEGFGFPIIEAMMCGCPVITSNRSSMPEVAGDAALLVNPDSIDELANALRRVTYDVELRQNLAAKGKARAECFSWEKLGDTVLNAYIEAAGRRG